MSQDGSSSFFETKYLLIVCIFLFCIRYYIKHRRGQKESISDRLWRKIAFSHQELLEHLDEQEKELLKHTYQNTIFNAKSKPRDTPKSTRQSEGKSKRVTFELEKNVTHSIPYNNKE